MAQDIDIFADGDAPRNHRWDKDKNAKLLNIVFQGGTFGNFLKFFLDKFSRLSPDLPGDIMRDTGVSHDIDKVKFSGLIQKYHFSFINDNEGESSLPICIILPSTKKHFLYLKKAQLFRAGDRKVSPDTLWQKPLGELKKILPDHIESIKKLYTLEEEAFYSWLPKFIVRDWYKLEFLQNPKDYYTYKWFDTFKKHKFFERQNVFSLDLESFFKWDTFKENIMNLDNKFGLSLDFGRIDEMKTLFDKGIRLDNIRQESNLAEQVIDSDAFYSLNDLDVATEGFIYAELEKRYPFIQMPLTNRFFRDTQEIIQYIEHFPNWYRRKNPNLD